MFFSYRKNFLGTQERVRISHSKRVIGVLHFTIYVIIVWFYRTDGSLDFDMHRQNLKGDGAIYEEEETITRQENFCYLGSNIWPWPLPHWAMHEHIQITSFLLFLKSKRAAVNNLSKILCRLSWCGKEIACASVNVFVVVFVVVCVHIGRNVWAFNLVPHACQFRLHNALGTQLESCESFRHRSHVSRSGAGKSARWVSSPKSRVGVLTQKMWSGCSHQEQRVSSLRSREGPIGCPHPSPRAASWPT